MYQIGETIEQTLYDIEKHKLVLPAIQREFVWSPEQVCRLFDSLMQGYPFGTFLYWKVEAENSKKFNFYDFVLNYHEKDSPHCPSLPEMPDRELTAILDGQQRLTALNVGLRGSMARKQPRLWWNNPSAFPQRWLYVDLLWQPDEDDERGLKYRFQFLTREESKGDKDNECWFRVGKILSMKDSGPAMAKWLNQRLSQDRMDKAFEVLFKLYQVVHTEKPVAFYEEKSQELEKVLQIFIRMNQGGTPLSYSDLLLSVAVAQWTKYDAREEIHAFVDYLNRVGGVEFSFSKDLILRAGLMLSDVGSVGFKVENFNRQNMEVFEDKWEAIKQAMILAVRLISSFGFSGQNLTSYSAILPIADYLYRRNPGEGYLMQSRFDDDRRVIREWLIRSLLKSGIWGSGLDTLLTALRRAIKEDYGNGFPISRIKRDMARQGKSLVFEDEEMSDLVDMRYGDRRLFALLSLLFDFVDLHNWFHIDHIFPRSCFTERKLKKAGIVDNVVGIIALRDGLANLQLLEGQENNEKRAKMPAEWLAAKYRDLRSRQGYADRHMLGDVPDSIVDFGDFYEARRARLRGRIEELLGRHARE